MCVCVWQIGSGPAASISTSSTTTAAISDSHTLESPVLLVVLVLSLSFYSYHSLC